VPFRNIPIRFSDFRFLVKLTITMFQSVGWQLSNCGSVSKVHNDFVVVSSLLSLLFVALLSGSRARNKFAPLLRALPSNFHRAYTEHESMVYIVFNVHSNDLYVGETQRPLLKRFREEINAATISAHTGTGTRFAVRVGSSGAQFWSVFPLALLGFASKVDRLRAERRAILHFNASLNSSVAHKRCSRLGRRRRALLAGKSAKRQHACDSADLPTLSFTRFVVQHSDRSPVAYPSLDQALRSAKNGSTVSICTIPGRYDLSNYHVLLREFAGRRATFAAIRSKRLNQCTVDVKLIRARATGIMEKLLHMARHPQGSRKLLQQCPIGTLLDLWVRAKDISSNRLRENVHIRLRAVMARRLKMRKLPSCVIRIPFAPNVDKAVVAKAARRMVSSLPLSARVQDWLRSQVRVVFLKCKSIARHLINNKQFARSVTVRPSACSCGCVDGHTCQRLCDFPCQIGVIGKVNAAAVPMPSTMRSSTALCRSFAEFTSQFEKLSRMPLTVLSSELRAAIKPGFSGSSESISLATVLSAKAQLGSLVVSRLDKNSGQLLAECASIAWKRLDKAFISCSHFQHTTLTADIAMRVVAADYKANGLHRFCNLLPGKLSYGYADPKQSDLSRSRGIVSYVAHPARSLFKLASKALTFLLRCLPSNVSHFTMFHLDRLPSDLLAMQRSLPTSRNRLVAFQTDVCEMFTNLQHSAVLDSILWLFDQASQLSPGRAQYRNTVAVKRFGSREVRWGRAYNADWMSLTFTDLFRIVQFDLRNVFFSVGDLVLKQNNGAPIGGFISALYGNVTCARAEHQYSAFLGSDRRLLAARRCQDDVFALIASDDQLTSIQRASDIRDDFLLNRVYTGGLTVKPVDIVDNRAKFVGATVHVGVSSVYCSAFNRNWNSLVFGRQTFPRFHPWSSFADNQSKFGVLLGSLRRLRRFCTFEASAIVECLKLFVELRCIGYPDHMFFSALRRLHQEELTTTTVSSRDQLLDLSSTFWSSVLVSAQSFLKDSARTSSSAGG
jgi:hypothetical protein